MATNLKLPESITYFDSGNNIETIRDVKLSAGIKAGDMVPFYQYSMDDVLHDLRILDSNVTFGETGKTLTIGLSNVYNTVILTDLLEMERVGTATAKISPASPYIATKLKAGLEVDGGVAQSPSFVYRKMSDIIMTGINSKTFGFVNGVSKSEISWFGEKMWLCFVFVEDSPATHITFKITHTGA